MRSRRFLFRSTRKQEQRDKISDIVFLRGFFWQIGRRKACFCLFRGIFLRNLCEKQARSYFHNRGTKEKNTTKNPHLKAVRKIRHCEKTSDMIFTICKFHFWLTDEQKQCFFPRRFPRVEKSRRMIGKKILQKKLCRMYQFFFLRDFAAERRNVEKRRLKADS